LLNFCFPLSNFSFFSNILISSSIFDTTEYTTTNQLTSTDADNIKGFSGVDLKTRISAACTPIAYSCYTSRLEIGPN
jgi:hypothetical protein